ncbi:peptidoglycan DD-metalloendopeptidase family protein [Aquibacillus salsiterrae]|uniref:Peptidoglycan DD-metalloendopeptidase family protein n=1 Tax=Aquibacillus salsiterrae TaxID=2950439 RepID=A0A9X4AG59_9BACI|nr:peptidoglycan DD-metalloendopeptidase family protein [Aquibacillus salsiterrae]MDC3416768.1 peptidoglycan DD-metalloendopeptidase family protein [Aquibacillus salsiterrae]
MYRTQVKRILVSMFVFLTFAIGVHAEPESVNLSTIYHVTVNDKHIGTISDKKLVEQTMDEIIRKQKETDQQLVPLTTVEWEPEKTFRAETDDSNTLAILSDNLEVGVEAVELSFGNERLYVSSNDDAQEVLDSLKNKYRPSEQTSKVDVQFSVKPELTETAVKPSEVLTAQEAIRYLTKGTLTDSFYQVKAGDVLGEIAASNDLSIDELKRINPDLNEDKLLQVGQKINVTKYRPLVDVIVKEEVTASEKIPFKVEVEKNKEMYKGQTKIKQKGMNGEKKVTTVVTKRNNNLESEKVIDEEVIKEPTKQVVVKGTKVVPYRGTGDFIWPTVGGVVTSPMGQRWGTIHKGTDIAGVSDRTIRAVDNGTVSFAGYSGSYGNKVVINHNNGFKTVYAHMQSLNVSAGQTVAKGTKIGVMGTTGDSTGVHLHIELYKNGKVKDLQDYARQ